MLPVAPDAGVVQVGVDAVGDGLLVQQVLPPGAAGGLHRQREAHRDGPVLGREVVDEAADLDRAGAGAIGGREVEFEWRCAGLRDARPRGRTRRRPDEGAVGGDVAEQQAGGLPLGPAATGLPAVAHAGDAAVGRETQLQVAGGDGLLSRHREGGHGGGG